MELELFTTYGHGGWQNKFHQTVALHYQVLRVPMDSCDFSISFSRSRCRPG